MGTQRDRGPSAAGRHVRRRIEAAASAATGSGPPARRADVPYVSPLRADAADLASVAALPRIAPAEPVPTYAPAAPGVGAPASDRDDEPALPDEARTRAAAEATAATAPLETAGPDRVLHVSFGGAPADQLVRAMELFRQLVRERPGDTRVVVHVPAPGGAALPMELKQAVAYDAELHLGGPAPPRRRRRPREPRLAAPVGLGCQPPRARRRAARIAANWST